MSSARWLARQLAAVRRADTPLVVLWGPPGCGARAVLAALREEGAGVAGPIDGREVVATARNVVVGEGLSPVDLEEWSSLVPPGATLVVAAPRAPSASAGVVSISPRRLALRSDEIEEWLGSPAEEVLAGTLGQRGLVALVADEPTALADPGHPAIHAYVHEELLPWLGLDGAELTLEAALAEGPVADPAGRLDPLVDHLGLAIRETSGKIRLPPILLPALRLEAERHLGAAVCSAQRRRWELLRTGLAEARPRDRPAGPRRSCRFALSLLGIPTLQRFEAEGGGEGSWRAVELGAPSAWLLLARLALARGRPVTLLELEESLLDGEEGNAPALHPILSRIRGRLGEPGALRREGAGYVLGPRCEDWWIDLDELDRTTAAVASDEDPRDAEVRLEQARTLGAGSLLEGIERRWLRRPRQRVRERRQEGLLRLGELLRRCGDGDRALDVLDQLIEEEPTHERAFLVSMEILAGAGRRDAVHRRYADLCTVLADELGAEPSAETTSVYHRLLGL